MKISVVISTTGRESIYKTLDSIYANNFSDFEIVLVSQKKKLNTQRKYPKLHYFHLDSIGLSKSRNFAIQKAQGEIIAFTDDDCIVDTKWLTTINSLFLKLKRVDGIFGTVLPYNPNQHKNKYCPCTLSKKKEIITSPCFHPEYIGFGNNMAFRKKTFAKYGNFKEWLGAGSIGASGEDGEYALRILSKGGALLSGGKNIVYHNKWLSSFENNEELLGYITGEITCYTYLAYQNIEPGKRIVEFRFNEEHKKWKSFFSRNHKLHEVKYFFWYETRQVIGLIKGYLLGLYFSIFEPYRSFK